MEIKIIRQSLRRTQQEQIDDINKSYKFEIEATKQEYNSEAEAGITTEIVQLQKAKELRLLQQEEFARKDSEIEGEKIRRRVEEALRDEQQKFSQMHQLQLQNIKQTYESKVKLHKNKTEMKNEQLFEASNTFNEEEAGIDKLRRDQERYLERKTNQYTKSLHQEIQHYKRQLEEKKEQRLKKIQQDYLDQIKLKQSEYETMKHLNQVQNDQSKQTLVKSMNKKMTIEKEKQQIGIIEKLGEVSIQSSIMLENQKKEI